MQSDPDAAEATARGCSRSSTPIDPDQEAEYQRLMRDELIESRSAGIDTAVEVLSRLGPQGHRSPRPSCSPSCQAVNSVRLVLGTILEVTEDDDLDAPPELVDSPEYQLYAYLVVASSTRPSGRMPAASPGDWPVRQLSPGERPAVHAEHAELARCDADLSSAERCGSGANVSVLSTG